MTLNKDDLTTTILNLFKSRDSIKLHDVAEAAKLSSKNASDRRAIQRALAKLIEQHLIKAEGNARARIYTLEMPKAEVSNEFVSHITTDSTFNDISLSDKSIKLLDYLSKPTSVRKATNYNHDFLRSYQPNKTFYLSSLNRKELQNAGTVENVVHPAGTYARDILNRLLIDLSWNSSRLEGNTYSLLETKRLIEFGEGAVGKNATEAQMILNHKYAIEYIVESANENKITAHEINSIHAILSDNLLGDPSASGRLRKIAVGISGTTYLPIDNPHVLDEYFNMFIKKFNMIKDPFEQSFFSLVHLSYLQAFEDVNKRTSRLVANIPLIKQNFKPLSFIDVNQKNYFMSLIGVYEKNDISLLRDLYIWAYKRSAMRYSALQQTMGETNLFKLKFRDEIQNIIRTIILNKTSDAMVVSVIKNLIAKLNLSAHDSSQLFQIIETEILNLHEGNVARFKIRPSEFQEWKK